MLFQLFVVPFGVDQGLDHVVNGDQCSRPADASVAVHDNRAKLLLGISRRVFGDILLVLLALLHRVLENLLISMFRNKFDNFINIFIQHL